VTTGVIILEPWKGPGYIRLACWSEERNGCNCALPYWIVKEVQERTMNMDTYRVQEMRYPACSDTRLVPIPHLSHLAPGLRV
jgi:hypothetical protein